ncbi:MAG: hypothetical protein WC765_10830 [Phycisphaerae bacterium]|jgi:hypothetical protein
MENVSSEQELLNLRRDGKITEDEFKQLLDALRKSPPSNHQQPADTSKKFVPLIILVIAVVSGAILLSSYLFINKIRPITQAEFRKDFIKKANGLNIDTANLNEVKKTFGEPIDYIWGDKIIERTKIPTDYYCIKYPDDVHLFMKGDSIVELRFESPAAGYVFLDKIKVGSSLEDVLDVIGQPTEIVEGQEIGWADGVLYKDVKGMKGYCYYHRSDQHVRFFFLNYKVKAMYITRSDYNGG